MSDNYSRSAYIWCFAPHIPMSHSSIHAKLAHLSGSQIDNLIARYYEGARIADLLSEFVINCQPAQLYKLLPPVIHASVVCPNCGATMMSQRTARHASQSKSNMSLYCPECHHQSALSCKCDYCHDRRSVKNDRSSPTPFDNRCSGIQSINRQDIKPADLTLELAIALLALIRCDDFGGGNEQRISASSLMSVPFAPRGGYAEILIEKLGKAAILGFSPASYYVFDALEDEGISALQFPIIWNISSHALIELVHEIEHCARTMEWPGHWINQLPKLKQSLALAECQEYYDLCIKQRGLPLSPHRSTTLMMINFLQDYSVAQCYRIIYTGARSAADFLVRTSCTAQHASNYMIGACQRWVDRARAEKWEVSPFCRAYELPRSMVSHVLYEDFLKCGDEGFNLVLDSIGWPKA